MKKSQNTSKTAPTDKIKVLCLHGYRQNGDSFKSKLGSFRKNVQKYADFVFVTAPHVAPPLTSDLRKEDGSSGGGGAANDDQRSWWFNKDDGSFKGTNTNGPAFGFDESIRLIERTWTDEGPFQGLLGFSQGASFVGLLCNLSARRMTKIKPHFAILSSGFRSGSLAHLNYYEDPVNIPSLHIFGETDDIIPREMSESLAATFVNPQILTHPGGHYFPATALQKQFYINHFQDLLQQHLEAKELENATAANSMEICDDGSGSDSHDDQQGGEGDKVDVVNEKA